MDEKMKKKIDNAFRWKDADIELDYMNLKNRPKINGIDLYGDRSDENYMLQRILNTGKGLTKYINSKVGYIIELADAHVEYDEEQPEYNIDYISLTQFNIIPFFDLLNEDDHREILIAKNPDSLEREFYIRNSSHQKIDLIFSAENSFLFMNENVCTLEKDAIKKFTFRALNDMNYSFLTFSSDFNWA
ncbi:MAG: hypothetical protein LBS69_03745 [Prevotellaceae bacterium]|jgi:hypothetical protein|nr:hypothetical protein [Prevotellaceae bacterium]